MNHPSKDNTTMKHDEATAITAEMAHRLSQVYFQNIQRIYLENNMQDTTLREYEKKRVKAEITAELCIDLMESLILQRFDYIVRNAVKHELSKEETLL